MAPPPDRAARPQRRNADSADGMADRDVMVKGVRPWLRPPSKGVPSPKMPKPMQEKIPGKLKRASMREDFVVERWRIWRA